MSQDTLGVGIVTGDSDSSLLDLSELSLPASGQVERLQHLSDPVDHEPVDRQEQATQELRGVVGPKPGAPYGCASAILAKSGSWSIPASAGGPRATPCAAALTAPVMHRGVPAWWVSTDWYVALFLGVP